MTAVEAAVAVARAYGLRVDEPVVLRDRLNVLVHLRPTPVVARVPGLITRIRPGEDWLRREVAVAGALAAAGAPVVAPSPELPPGPHHHQGRVVSFWTYIAPRELAGPAAAGAALGEVHEALRSLRVSLPVLGHITEAEAMLAMLAAEEAVDPETADDLHDRIVELRDTLAALRAPVLPLHGDAHLRNVLNGPDGPLWNDWEDCCVGPLHWDAACLLAPGAVAEQDDGARAAAHAARMELDPAELAIWIDARILQGAVWSIYMGRPRDPWVQTARRRGGG